MAKSSRQVGVQFVRYFGPLLDALRDLGGSCKPQEAVERVAANLGVSDELLNETMRSGGLRFQNQVHWARFYLARAGLMEASRRGVWSLSEVGRQTHLSDAEADEIFLTWSKLDQKNRRDTQSSPDTIDDLALSTVELADEQSENNIVDTLHGLSPKGFEQFCQRLLRESGFSEVHVTGQSGDGGIDGHGTLEINPLVSFKVLFQCKKHKNSVSSPAVRDFRGAMQGRADKGIILSTGVFTTEARREASRDGVPPIELIDGQKITELMQKLELGVTPRTIYEIDRNFFSQFE